MFKCLLIKPHKINHLSWNEPDYISTILNFCLEIELENNDFFIDNVLKFLDTEKLNIKNINLKNIIFHEEPEHSYNLIYLDLIAEDNLHLLTQENEIAMLINNDPKQIYSNVILCKEYIPALSNNTTFIDMTKANLELIFEKRKNFKILTWDSVRWSEHIIPIDNLYNFIDSFFDEEKPDKKHIDFFMHNLNILYTSSKYGSIYCCGKLLDDIPVEKCIVYTMLSEEHIGDITLNEFKKITKLSEKIDKYVISDEFLIEDKTNHGRSIKQNKYRILDKMYNKYY